MEITKQTKFQTTVASIIALIGFIVWITLGYARIQAELTDDTKRIQDVEMRISSIEKNINRQDVEYAKIETELKAIQATLLEIKSALR